MPKPRERILNTAMVLFHKQGYNNTVIDEADVSKASFYLYSFLKFNTGQPALQIQ